MTVPTTSKTPDDDGQDRPEFASRKVIAVGGRPAPGDDSLMIWSRNYLGLAVDGVRSAEVASKITRHLDRFESWFTEGFGHDRISAVTPREVGAWRDQLAAEGIKNRDGSRAPMAAATVNNHLAHLSAMFTWTAVHAPAGLLAHGDPTKGIEPLPLPAPEPRALAEAQVRTVKNVLDRIEVFHRLTGRAHRDSELTPAVHRHARPLRDRAIVHLMLGTGLRRAEVCGLDLERLEPCDPAELRRVKKARLTGVRGKGRTTRTVFLGLDARTALADYLESERNGDADEQSDALFLAAASIATRRAGGRLSPRSINTIVGEIGAIHDLEVTDSDRKLDGLRPHDLRHSFAYRLSAASGHNRAELERRLGHANDRYLKLYTNPPEEIAAGWAENL